jgi:hypothetical protein
MVHQLRLTHLIIPSGARDLASYWRRATSIDQGGILRCAQKDNNLQSPPDTNL